MRVFQGVLTESVTNQKNLEEKRLTETKNGSRDPQFFLDIFWKVGVWSKL